LSLYRRAVLENGSICPVWVDYDYKEGAQGSVEYWKQRRSATRLLQRSALRDPEFATRRDSAQGKLVSLMARRAGPAEDAGLSGEIGRIVKEFEGGD
jgi:hypothetical protein